MGQKRFGKAFLGDMCQKMTAEKGKGVGVEGNGGRAGCRPREAVLVNEKDLCRKEQELEL